MKIELNRHVVVYLWSPQRLTEQILISPGQIGEFQLADQAGRQLWLRRSTPDIQQFLALCRSGSVQPHREGQSYGNAAALNPNPGS